MDNLAIVICKTLEKVGLMLSVISILCELQQWTSGCPFGYLPTFDANQGALYQGCTQTSQCFNGSECKFSPITASSVCCKTNPMLFSPLEQIVFVYPYVGYQETYTVTDRLTPRSPTTPAAATPTPTTPTAIATTVTTAAAATTPQTNPTTTVSRIVNVTATAPPAAATRMIIPQILLPVNPISAAPIVYQLMIGRYDSGVSTTTPSVRTGTVSLICDNGYNILVDTGINYRQNEMLAALAMRGFQPYNIHTVIITHGHPDHFGGGGLFPNAQFIFGPYIYRGDQFVFSGLNMAPTVRLSLNSDLWNTPGHTPDSLSVMVKNVPGCGIIAITGDLFINQNDIANPSLWRDLAWDFVIQQQSRNLILCQVNWIIPGHGQIFPVTDQIKRSNGCPISSLSSVATASAPAIAAAPSLSPAATVPVVAAAAPPSSVTAAQAPISVAGSNVPAVVMNPQPPAAAPVTAAPISVVGSNIPAVIVNQQPAPMAPAAPIIPPAPMYYAGSSIPLVNPLPAPPAAPPVAPAPPVQAPAQPAGSSDPSSAAPAPTTIAPPSTTPQYVIYYNPPDKGQQKIVFTNQFGQPLSPDDQKFLELQLYPRFEQTGYNSYSVLWPPNRRKYARKYIVRKN